MRALKHAHNSTQTPDNKLPTIFSYDSFDSQKFRHCFSSYFFLTGQFILRNKALHQARLNLLFYSSLKPRSTAVRNDVWRWLKSSLIFSGSWLYYIQYILLFQVTSNAAIWRDGSTLGITGVSSQGNIYVTILLKKRRLMSYVSSSEFIVLDSIPLSNFSFRGYLNQQYRSRSTLVNYFLPIIDQNEWAKIQI